VPCTGPPGRHPADAPARDWLVLAAATASGSAKIIVKTRSPRAAAAEITWAQGRQAGDPALEAAVLRGPANGDRAIGGLRTAVPYPHHVAS